MRRATDSSGETTDSHIQAQVEYFGRELYRLRTEAHMSQMDLTRALGLKSSTNVARLEKGQQPPTFALLVRLKNLFGVTMASLVEPSAPHHTNTTTIHTIFSASGGSVMFFGCEHIEALMEWVKTHGGAPPGP